jgi:hypothetical protein
VLNAIDAFWDEVHSVGADVLAVVTTRPQGYNHDLDPRRWQHWSLSPLPPTKAIGYAEKLADVRISDRQRREAIIEDIKKACADPATKLLTTTPLQVAILFGISFLKGNIPQDRWELFDKYYNLLRDREAQKPGATSAFIRDNKRTIDAIHHDCGWLLHVEAERKGRTGAFLTDKQFRNAIETLLKAEEYDDEQIVALSGKFEKIATERLVLLATRVEGQISFDVRSLQEYMAAAMAGSDQKLFDARLRAIAASAHWRHVFRIAASKVFSVVELGHLRTTVVAICDALDKGDLDEAAPLVKAGSMLALELLADGVAASAPRFQKQLSIRALGLLEAGEAAFDPRLSTVSDRELLTQTITFHVNSGKLTHASAAWRLLLLLASQHGWAERLMLDLLPEDASKTLELFHSTDVGTWPKSLQSHILDAQRRAGPEHASEFVQRLLFAESEQDQSAIEPVTLMPQLQWRHLPGASDQIITLKTFSGLKGRITTNWLGPVIVASISDQLEMPLWANLIATKQFAAEPTHVTLAQAIAGYTESAGEHRLAYDGNAFLMPWVLRSLVADFHEGHAGSELAQMAREGAFGRATDWKAAEHRWRTEIVRA